MSFPRAARYDVIMKAVYDFIVKEDIRSFPINPINIIRNNKWGLISYTELAKENELTIDQVKSACGSQDGYVIFDGDNYTIAYNDTIESPLRIRFTLMHEIGHIMLNHLTEFEETTLTRSSISKTQYRTLEREANGFARNVLSPPFLVKQFRVKFGKYILDHTSNCFKISNSAVRTRMQMLEWDLKHVAMYTPALMNHLQGFTYRILNSKQCRKCGLHLISRFAAHCPICSNRSFSRQRSGKPMIFTGFDVDDNGRAFNCPRCGNEEIAEHAEYCKICAASIVNKCTNVEYDGYSNVIAWACNTPAEGNARYCIKCGSETTFFREGLLKSWEQEVEEEKVRQRTHLREVFGN